jgi:hypothetical protein
MYNVLKVNDMNIELTHKFTFQAHDIDALLLDCNSLPEYCKRFEAQSLLYPDRYEPDNYKGDGFELFVEALIKLHPADNRIGIGNYSPIEGLDTGVDGTGVGTNGKPAAVQCKYKSNHTTLLTANDDHLSNFIVASVFYNDVDPKDKNNMLIVTTGLDLAPFTKNEMFDNRVRCLGWQQLREMVDNNIVFWDMFRQLIS